MASAAMMIGVYGVVGGQSNDYLWSMDDLAPSDAARQLTSTAGPKSDVQWSPD